MSWSTPVMPKSVATLRKSGCAIAQYAEWAGGARGFLYFEEGFYEYASHLKQEGAAATRATSFIEVVHFSSSLLGIDIEPGATKSARVTGVVMASYDRKRVTRQAPPLEIGLVRGLEIAIRTAREFVDRSVARFALFVLFAKATLSDAARADGAPTLDVDDVGQGYVEVRTTSKRVKTGRGKRRRHRLLPMVAPAQGLTDRS